MLLNLHKIVLLFYIRWVSSKNDLIVSNVDKELSIYDDNSETFFRAMEKLGYNRVNLLKRWLDYRIAHDQTGKECALFHDLLVSPEYRRAHFLLRKQNLSSTLLKSHHLQAFREKFASLA